MILFLLVVAAISGLKQALAFLLVYNGVLALLLRVDWLLTAKPDSLRMERFMNPGFPWGPKIR